MRSRVTTRLGVAALCLAVAGAASGAQQTVTFPLVVDHPILEAELRRHLALDENGSLELWGTPGDCHWAVVDETSLGAHERRFRLTAKGSAVVGFRLLWFCISPLAWQGTITIDTRAVVGRDWQLRFEMLDVEARDLEGRPSTLGNSAVQLVREQLEERLRAFHFDLGPPIAEGKALIRSASNDHALAALAALDTLRPLETVVDGEGVRVRVAMDVPEADEKPTEPERPLSADEVRAWENRIDRWDAFLIFAVKTLGGANADRREKSELLAILLDGRRELVEVLQQGPVPGTDPVRTLFLSSWDRLRVQTRAALRDGRLGDRAFRFVTFLAAGDALAALDQAGPGLGLEISADGLRRLARIADPDRTGDPIAVSDAPDDELRTLFGFESGLPAAPASSTSLPTTTTTGTPPTTLPVSWPWAPRAAHAATVDLADVARRLDRWVPSPSELATYRELVEQLLTVVGGYNVWRVADTFAVVYRDLVPAVAWQESCWRHFVERDGKVTVLLSRTGDVGIMQVNRRVWRGFYDLRKLEQDVVYNTSAGAEILVQLLTRYGRKEGSGDAAARATYSAYNGGPAAYRRYRSPKARPRDRAVDAAFYEKYRLVAAGTAGDRVLCM
jgi:hypothetical protein